MKQLQPVQIETFCKPFSSEEAGVFPLLIDETGIVSVWDSIAGHWTRCHSLSEHETEIVQGIAQAMRDQETESQLTHKTKPAANPDQEERETIRRIIDQEVWGLDNVVGELLDRDSGLIVAGYSTDNIQNLTINPASLDWWVWGAGWSFPGCLPESDPAYFADRKSAIDYLVESIEHANESDEEVEPIDPEDYRSALISQGSTNYGGMVYWYQRVAISYDQLRESQGESEGWNPQSDDWTNTDGEDTEAQVEIFQWFRISDWLHGKLTEIGEPTLETDWGNYWGRTTFGQSLEDDYCFRKIAKGFLS